MSFTVRHQPEPRMYTVADVISAAQARGLRCSMDILCESTAKGEFAATQAPPLKFPESAVLAWLDILAARQNLR
jgi:hypothetical protein